VNLGKICIRSRRPRADGFRNSLTMRQSFWNRELVGSALEPENEFVARVSNPCLRPKNTG
jgi:hypothetical protein